VIEEEEVHTKEVFDIYAKTINFNKRRVTDTKGNRRVIVPRAAGLKKEMQFQSLKNKIIDTTTSYQCKEMTKHKTWPRKSANLATNTDKAIRQGLKSLKNRVKEDEILIYQTDKSGRFSVDKPENYIKSMFPLYHLDRLVCMEEVDKLEKQYSAHAGVWGRILGIGETWRQQARVKEALSSKNLRPPPLYGLYKDHKVGWDPTTGPPTRPVCGAVGGMSQCLSSIMSEILSYINSEADKQVQCKSTEDLLAAIDTFNENKYMTPCTVLSTDVKALYPSLDQKETSEAIYDLVMESTITMDGVDYVELSRYLPYLVDRDTIES
jgi:hypothetical protein